MNSYCGSSKIRTDNFGKPYTHVLFDKKTVIQKFSLSQSPIPRPEPPRHLVSTDAFASGLRPAGGEASGLQPSGIDSPTLFPLLSPPSLPPSLPPSGLRPPAGLRRRPSAYVGFHHARGFASDRALAAAFSATCGISLEKYMFRCKANNFMYYAL